MREALSQNFLVQSVPSCSGCTACMNSCPTGSIVMKEDGNGFRYPSIDESLCIGCRKCIKVCPVYHKEVRGCSLRGSHGEPVAYGGWILDEGIRRASSSGGVFSALALAVLEKGGVVYGASMGEDLRVRHIRVEDAAQLSLLRGAKYRQSEVGIAYQNVRQDLKAGIPVLFSGVPCQIGGLLSFLGARHEHLLTVDMICHGVPSDRLFDAYVKWQEAGRGSCVRKVNFRDKRTGWQEYSLTLEFEGGALYSAPFTKDPFMGGFLMDLFLRPGCYSCVYHKMPRHADITLGDFWGVKWVAPELERNEGVSLVLEHSEKGREALRAAGARLYLQQVDFQKAVAQNPSYSHSAPMPGDYRKWAAGPGGVPLDQWMRRLSRRWNPSMARRLFHWTGRKARALLRRWKARF